MPYVKLDLKKYAEGKPQPKGYFNALLHNQAYSNDIENDEWERKLNELFNYLAHGVLPEGVKCRKPKMSLAQAKDILWFLREVTKIIPDDFAPCDECENIQAEIQYYAINGKHYCESCNEHSPVCRCFGCGIEMRINENLSCDDRYYCKKCRKDQREKRRKEKA